MTLGALSDVNVAGATNGMVLVYNSTTGKWDATNQLINNEESLRQIMLKLPYLQGFTGQYK